jgi:hypothetical protein
LISDFEELHATQTINFFLWSDFLLLTTEQLTTLVQRINSWRRNYRIILINGFIDKDDNVPMFFNPIDQPDISLSKISVTEYMQTMVKTANGENLFHYEYPPQAGFRETLEKI